MKRTIEERMKHGHWVDCELHDLQVGDIVDTCGHPFIHPTEVAQTIRYHDGRKGVMVTPTAYWKFTELAAQEKPYRKWIETPAPTCPTCGAAVKPPADGTYICRDKDGDIYPMILDGGVWFMCSQDDLEGRDVEGAFPPYTPIKRVILEDV